MEYDGEGEILFYYKDFHDKMEIFKPLISCPNRSAYSIKNLPKSDYVIPEVDNDKYKKAIEEMETYHINKIYSIFADKYDIDMKYKRRELAMTNKQYIHHLGMWNELLDEISEYRSNLK